VPTRKEEQERRRAERLAAEQQVQRATQRRLMAGYIVAGAMTLAIVVGLVVVIASGGSDGAGGGEDIPANAHVQVQSGVTHDVPYDDREGTAPPELQQGDLQKAAQAANCELRLNLPDEGSTHITNESQIPNYKTNPPTSGNHNPEQMADGAYSEMPDPWYFVHSLEHGRIEIQYSPDLPEEDQLALKGVFDEKPEGVLFFPNPDMPYEVAVTAWTQLMGCKTYEGDATLDAVRDFRDIYIGQGPEGVPIVTG
jgi:Protein of unknown function (DUF3105)